MPAHHVTPSGPKQLSMAVVLERARARLREARGDDVAVREGVVTQQPYIRQQPADVDVDEGMSAEFTTAAGVSTTRVLQGLSSVVALRMGKVMPLTGLWTLLRLAHGLVSNSETSAGPWNLAGCQNQKLGKVLVHVYVLNVAPQTSTCIKHPPLHVHRAWSHSLTSGTGKTGSCTSLQQMPQA